MKNIKISVVLFRVAIMFMFMLFIPYACADIVSEIRNLNSEAATEYPEVDDIKQDVLLLLYTMDRNKIPDQVKNFSMATKDFIEEFNAIYLLSRKGGIKEKREAIKKCVELRNKIPKADENYLQESDASSCAKTLIKKFIHDEGVWFENLANNENMTRLKIIYFRDSSYAYSESGDVIKAEIIKISADTLEAKYYRDMEKANSLYSEGKNLMFNLSDNSTMIDKINAVVSFNSALRKYEESKRIYDYHHESDYSNKTNTEILKIKSILPSLEEETRNFFIILAGVFAAALIFLFERINEWKKAMYDVSLGEELFRVST